MNYVNEIMTRCDCALDEQYGRLSYSTIRFAKLPWIFPGAPLKINGALGNIPGNLRALYNMRTVMLCFVVLCFYHYRETSSISRTKSQNVNVSNLVLQLSLLNPLKPGVKSSRRCIGSSADRRCSNYIWVIDNFIAYQGATYIRGSTVFFLLDLHDAFNHTYIPRACTNVKPCYNTICWMATVLGLSK